MEKIVKEQMELVRLNRGLFIAFINGKTSWATTAKVTAINITEIQDFKQVFNELVKKYPLSMNFSLKQVIESNQDFKESIDSLKAVLSALIKQQDIQDNVEGIQTGKLSIGESYRLIRNTTTILSRVRSAQAAAINKEGEPDEETLERTVALLQSEKEEKQNLKATKQQLAEATTSAKLRYKSILSDIYGV